MDTFLLCILCICVAFNSAYSILIWTPLSALVEFAVLGLPGTGHCPVIRLEVALSYNVHPPAWYPFLKDPSEAPISVPVLNPVAMSS